MSDVSSVPSRPQSPVVAPNDHLPPPRPYRFTWDPASRRPGPESISGTTEGRGADDFGGTQSHFGLFTNNLAPASIPTEWSSSRTGFHGISFRSFIYHIIVHLIYSSYINRIEQPS